MRKLITFSLTSLAVAMAGPAEAQFGGRVSAEPYVAYGFFGSLPETTVELEATVAYGARIGYQLAPQWGVFGNFQRSNPAIVGSTGASTREITTDHWSGGVEFSYVPRGGAEGMLPILLEAGVGQARYNDGRSDFAVNVGIASAFQLSPNFAVRYGANDYISNYGDNAGVVNQIFARLGGELTF